MKFLHLLKNKLKINYNLITEDENQMDYVEKKDNICSKIAVLANVIKIVIFEITRTPYSYYHY